MTETIRDPALYARCSVPFENDAEADTAIRTFLAELRASREKHELRDVYVIIATDVMGEDGKPQQTLATLHCGDALKAKVLTAYAFGAEQRADRERIDEIIRQGAGGA